MSPPSSVVGGCLAAASVLLMCGLLLNLRRVHHHRAVVGRFAAGDQPRRPRAGRVTEVLGPPPSWFVVRMTQAGWGSQAARWWPRWIAGLSVVPASAAVMAGFELAVAVLGLGAAAPLVVLRARRGRDRLELETALPALVEDVAGGVRAGLALPVALGAAAGHDHGPWNDDLEAMAAALSRGGVVGVELRRWGESQRCDGLGLTVAAMALAAEGGGTQAKALDGVAKTLRARAAIREEVVALSSQARASAMVMAVTPLAFAALAALTDPRTADFLLHDAAGVACLVGGCLLDLAAGAWMLRITNGGAAVS